MKLTRKQNPYGVQQEQWWKPKDSRRRTEIEIALIVNKGDEVFAFVAHYKKGSVTRHTMINLLNFNRFEQIK